MSHKNAEAIACAELNFGARWPITPIVLRRRGAAQSAPWRGECQAGVATRYAGPLAMRHLHDFLSVNWTKWMASPIAPKLFLS